MSRESSYEMGRMQGNEHACESSFCQDVHSRLYAFLDGECDQAERKYLEDHIHQCPECLEEFGSEQAIRRLLRRCCQQPAPEELRQRIATRIRISYTSIEYRR